MSQTFRESARDRYPEFGSFVPYDVPRRRAVRSSFPSRERANLRPEGTLIAHLSEHTAPITALVTAPDSVFFASASEDGTVKVWDTMRLEKNVTSKSRHTLSIGGQVLALCMLHNTHCLATSSTNGLLNIYRIDVSLNSSLPRYGKHNFIRQYSCERRDEHITAIVHLEQGER